MNRRAGFDVGPLSWVKREIDTAMQRGVEALRAFAASVSKGAQDPVQLKAAQTHLHQALGALKIVGLDGVTRITEEIEALLGDFEKEAGRRSAEHFSIAENGFREISAYLDGLTRGAPNQPLRLLRVYNALLEARGAGPADPVDLYFPNLSFRPPARETSPVNRHPEELKQYLRDQRTRYQRGLLKFLKSDMAGAEDMRAAVEAIELIQGFAGQRTFWWVTLGFLDALARGALAQDSEAKRLCNRIEQQIRRLVEGSQNVAERLLREVLYLVARASPASDHLRAVQESFQLAGTVPGAQASAAPAADAGALESAREALNQAKEDWNGLATGAASSVSAACLASSTLAERVSLLGHTDLARLATQVAAAGEWLAQDPSRMSEALALEVATALLLAEDALGKFDALGGEFAQQAAFVCSRLAACMEGRLLRTAPEIPLLGEMSRRAQERLLTEQVVAEMQVNLRSVEQVLDGFFRDPSRRETLAAIDKPLHQLEGALDMLGEARAKEALAACSAQIRRLVAHDTVPREQDFEAIAQTLSGLGFYVEALARGNANFDEAMSPLGSARAQPTEAAQPAATVEAQLAEQHRQAQKLAEEWKKKPTDTLLKEELQRSLASILKDADLVADARLGAAATEALRVLKTGEAMPLEPLVAQALGQLSDTAQAPSPSLETTELAQAGAEAVDAELLAVYLEEADEVLASIRRHLDSLRALHSDHEALVTIRRGFHTLKGSGRMVGLTRLGEAAWAVEQTLNLWLQDDRAATAPLLDMVVAAHDYFADGVTRLKAGGTSSDEQALVALAEAVRRGDAARVPIPVPTPAQQTPAQAELPALAVAPQALEPLSSAGLDSARPGVEPEIPSGVLPEMRETRPAAPRAVSAETAPAPQEEATVEIGGQNVSVTLYTIFSGEARMRLASLKEEYETLRAHGIITDTMLRAVHTIAGISATVHFDALHDLAHAFESALSTLSWAQLCEDEEALIEQAIDVLEQMVVEALGLAEPTPAPELVERLEHIASLASAERGPAPLERAAPEVLVPEEEGALHAPQSAPGGAAEISVAPSVPSGPEALAAPAMHAAQALAQAVSSLSEVEELAQERRQRRLKDEFDPQLLPLFVDETNELLPAIGSVVRDWRGDPGKTVHGRALQRLLHTLKGGARMAGAMALGELAHHMETRVERALALGAAPAKFFEEIEASVDRIGALFERVQSPVLPAAAEGLARAVAAPAAPGGAPQREEAAARASVLRVRAGLIDHLVNEAGEVSIARSRIEGEMRVLKGAMQELTDNVARLRRQLREIEIQSESQVQSRRDQAQALTQDFDPLEFDRFTRFQELTRMMAESVNDVQTVQQNLVHAIEKTEAALATQARLNRDLQQDLMRVRMVPFASLAERLHRIVRQTAKELGKRANLDIHAVQVELDRSVLERMTAPLEHMLRNAVMHGVESPEQRTRAGKAAIGEIRLDVSQEANEVVLALADDGAGLDIERIRRRAVSMGLTHERAALSEAEVADFIFIPGVTTAHEVSAVAGRGVGMDVARSETALLGGRIELSFERGRGTRFVIYLPLTLAVTQAVLVKSAARTYAIPAVMVEQVQQMRSAHLAQAYEAGHAEWQERRYPFHGLAALLGAPEARASEKRASPVLYVRSGSSSIALLVDEIASGSQEIVVKAIGPQLARVPGIAGATVLGSGEIVLIVNPVQLARREAAVPAPVPAEEPAKPAQSTVMVVDDSLTVRKITGRLLERQGYRVVTARDGVEAMELLQELTPQVMLVDIEMPRMDGFDLTRNVRADSRLAGIPIIVISSRNVDKHQQYASEIGVDGFLGKPYREEELLRRVAGHIAAGRAFASPRG